MSNLESIIKKINAQNGVTITRPQDETIELFTQVQKFPRQVELNLGNGTKKTLNLNQCIPVGTCCEPCGDYLNQPTIGVADESFSTTRPQHEIQERNFCEAVKTCNNGEIE